MHHAQACTNPNKLNLGVGAYRTEVCFGSEARVLVPLRLLSGSFVLLGPL